MSRKLRIAVCLPQVPFERGGAEIQCEALVGQLRQRDFVADLVTVPYSWYPNRNLLTNAMVWRTLDFTRADGLPIDALIGTKFPSYLARHPRKVVWLIHQFRQAYDMHNTEFAQFKDDIEGLGMRRAIVDMDATALGEARAIFTTSKNLGDRLRHFNGIDSTPLPAPPQRLDLAPRGDEGYVLSVGRLSRAKRLDLLIAGLAEAPSASAVVVGDGPDRERLGQLAHQAGVTDRIDFRGRVDEEELSEAYGNARAVFYAPFDEDYGFVPIEAHLAGKPVITTSDAGGPLEIVIDGATGLVCPPDGASVGVLLESISADPDGARRMGARGREHAETITWDRVIDTLIGAAGL